MDDLAVRGESFSFETTLAGISYQHRIREWREQGYTVILIFLQLPNIDLALDRVADRVRQGGHNIPEATIRRRFVSGLRNFENLYKPIVDKWMLYDNSGLEPVLVQWDKNK
jgi:predicted ABC-type ATPase